MTSDEWLASTDPDAMLRHLTHERSPDYGETQPRGVRLVSDRKLRLFAVAWWRQILPHSESHERRAVELETHLDRVAETLIQTCHDNCKYPRDGGARRLQEAGTALLRDIVGNPFLRKPWRVHGGRAWTTNAHGQPGTNEWEEVRWLTPTVTSTSVNGSIIRLNCLE